jgi:hypothetical protein
MYVAASLRPVGSVMVRRIRDPSRVRPFVYAVIRCLGQAHCRISALAPMGVGALNSIAAHVSVQLVWG